MLAWTARCSARARSISSGPARYKEKSVFTHPQTQGILTSMSWGSISWTVSPFRPSASNASVPLPVTVPSSRPLRKILKRSPSTACSLRATTWNIGGLPQPIHPRTRRKAKLKMDRHVMPDMEQRCFMPSILTDNARFYMEWAAHGTADFLSHWSPEPRSTPPSVDALLQVAQGDNQVEP